MENIRSWHRYLFIGMEHTVNEAELCVARYFLGALESRLDKKHHESDSKSWISFFKNFYSHV